MDKGFGQINKDLLIFIEFLSSSSWVSKSNNCVTAFPTDEDTTYISLQVFLWNCVFNIFSPGN